MKKIQIILMAVLLAAGAGYSAVLTNLTVTFTGQTAGIAPTGATVVGPLVPTTSNFVQVVASSAIGSGEAVRIYDASINPVGGDTELRYNFVQDHSHQENAVGVKFQYSQRATLPAGGVGNLNISIGEIGGSTKIVELQLRNSGDVRSVFDGNTANIIVAGGNPLFAAGTVHTVEYFANDQNLATVNYIQGGNSYVLNANSYAIWIDGVNYGGTSGGFITRDTPVDGANTNIVGYASAGNTEWNFGRLTFNSTTSVAGLDYDIDNIQVTALIPEPATMGMLLLGAVTVFAVRRRRA